MRAPLELPVSAFFDGTITADQIERLKPKVKDLPVTLDVRLRDLRRNFATRLATLGMENDLRQRILGHEQSQTTFNYTQADLSTALAAKSMLDASDEPNELASTAVN